MDRSIARRFQSEVVHIDSAFRGDHPTYLYKAFFNSLENRTSKIIKDVIGLRINKVSLPRMSDNVLSGFNIVNLHISAVPTTDIATLTSELELEQYLSQLSPHLVLRTEVKKIKSSRFEERDKKRAVYKISSRNGNQLIYSSNYFPGSVQFDSDFCLLVTQEEQIWDIKFPINLSLSMSESHRILLKPGYYPTTSFVITELFEALTSQNYAANTDLQFHNDYGENSPGWSVFKEARGKWSLFFRTEISDINIFFSHEPGPYDFLQQLGLRSFVKNWAVTRNTKKITNQIFKMTKRSFQSLSSDETSNTIVGTNSMAAHDLFELEFDFIDLFPRRYVDVLIDNVPISLNTNSTTHRNGVFVRVDLTQNYRVSYSMLKSTNTSNMDENFDEESTLQNYIIFENNQKNDGKFFDPVSLDHLDIRLIDNFGRNYDSEYNHTIEIELVTLGDALEPFDFPIADTGSFLAPKRKLSDKNKKPKRYEPDLQTVVTTPTVTSPIIEWTKNNRFEIGICAATFSFVLWLSHKLGFFYKSENHSMLTQSVSSHPVSPPPLPPHLPTR